MTTKKFSSVWDAIADTKQEAVSMKVRSDLMRAIQEWMTDKGCTQTDAATLFGVTQPRISDLVRGRISLFSTDVLLDMAATAGLRPKVTVHLTAKKTAPTAPTKRYRKEVAVAA
ncbi:helix-turn-helix domain-containing protein [Fluviibacter phosphoraccumulans]|jgi:predicted XRE-type DNA-binding protein|uniref:Transcriptional regulator n=1 Tax=Fluviibacter phosphoraccumulans TaxID=1751046 RepID=A0A679I6I9_9RHOO|nr:XRE family transcriptional regulator [Fluviibacter phosphoraccumulans]BBU70045.1 transcriptional regulator [Fluviibacter phosphoraccumulans]BBU70763.1 transcriptional regulator [Fluviibacter phosphoraccumulans]BCA65883.1 transcriptional regulator [Fluviibacter phosphoraccumulans]